MIVHVSIKIETRLSLSLQSLKRQPFLKGTHPSPTRKMLVLLLSVDNFLRSRLLPTRALGVVFGFLLLRFARIRFRLPFSVGKRTNDTHRTREEEVEVSARERSIKKKDTHNMRNQKKTRVPPTKKYAKVYLVRLLELFLLRVGELLFLLRLFVDGHFYCYRACVRVCVR